MLLYLNEEDDDEYFEIVPDQSYMYGLIDAADPSKVLWDIYIEWFNPEIEGHSYRHAHIYLYQLNFGQGNWKDLVDRKAYAGYDPDDVPPIDDPGSFLYYSSHRSVNDAHLTIVSRNGPDFKIECRCNIEYPSPPGDPLEFCETVTLKNVYVAFKDATPVDPKLARELATRFVESESLGEATTVSAQSKWVGFPVKAAYERPVIAEPPRRKPKYDETDPAVIALKELDIKVRRDLKSPGLPVIEIHFGPGDNCDDALALVKEIKNVGDLHLHTFGATDRGLAHIQDMTQISVLSISDSSITDDGLAYLRNLTRIYSLSIRCSALTGQGLAHLRGLQDLESLDIQGAALSDLGVANIAEFSELRRVSISGPFTDSGLVHLEGLLKLGSLSMSGEFTDAGLIHLKPLQKLGGLRLGSDQILGPGLIHLKDHSNLKSLHLFGTSIGDESLAFVGQLENLKNLWLSSTTITDAGILSLKRLTKLRDLYVRQTKVTKEGAAALRKFLPKLCVEPYWYP